MSVITPSDMKLYSNGREREEYDNMADLFAIIKTTEALEKAYVRDAVSQDDYTRACKKLIAQFQTAQSLCKDSVPDVRRFMLDYKMDCKAATKRLVEEGVPASVGHADDSSRVIAETVQFFITAMDNLKLNNFAKDQVHPGLGDLYDSLCKISSLPPTWEGKVKLSNWLMLLNQMKASDELESSQVRQLLFDLDAAYTAFHKSLAPRQ